MAKNLDEELRNEFVEVIKNWLNERGEEVQQYKSNEIGFPCVDTEGNEKFIKIAISIPRGERNGDPFDGYVAAQNYEFECAAKAEKAREAAAKKEAKIKKDAERRVRQEELKEKRFTS